MRTSEAFVSVCILTFGLCAPAYSFDGTAGDNSVAPAVSVDIVGRGAVTSAPVNVPAPALASPSQSLAIPNPVIAAPARPRSFDASRKPTAMEAFRAGTQSLRAGDVKGGISALEYAAENGHPVAQWKLGRIYADGDGVARDDLRAFEYFREIADAQFNLGRIYADGVGVAKDGRLAARWLGLAANKGQHQAQALLGGMLFKGDVIPRQAARGLMLLTLASDSAQQQETWIRDLHDSAFKQATDDERQMALMYLERQLKGGGRQ
jgi:TPR repeat protein